MSRKMGNECSISKEKRNPKDGLDHALDTLTTAHRPVDEQEAEDVKKAIQKLPDDR